MYKTQSGVIIFVKFSSMQLIYSDKRCNILGFETKYSYKLLIQKILKNYYIVDSNRNLQIST